MIPSDGSATVAGGALRLCIFEQQTANNQRERTWLVADPLALQLNDEPPLPLPAGCLARVFARYGLAFDEAELRRDARQLEWIGELTLPQGTIRHFRHLSWFDVVARDYLVYGGRGASPPDAATPELRFDLCTSVAAVLTHLATAYARACISPE